MHLRAYRSSSCLTVEIADNGCGMSEDTLNRVTEPFFTTRSDGTGLGLSITRQLVELNGGEMHLRSLPGQGTTVSVTLPAGKSGNLITDQ